jgi:cytoskeletal protein RodZ
LASKSENAEIAVLQSQMEDQTRLLHELKTSVDTIKDSLESKYATKEELKSFRRFALPATIIITAVITSLVAFFFANIGVIRQGVNTPGTTTTTTTSSSPSGSGTPSASANSTATSTPENPKATDSQSSGGGITIPLPKL